MRARQLCQACPLVGELQKPSSFRWQQVLCMHLQVANPVAKGRKSMLMPGLDLEKQNFWEVNSQPPFHLSLCSFWDITMASAFSLDDTLLCNAAYCERLAGGLCQRRL